MVLLPPLSSQDAVSRRPKWTERASPGHLRCGFSVGYEHKGSVLTDRFRLKPTKPQPLNVRLSLCRAQVLITISRISSPCGAANVKRVRHFLSVHNRWVMNKRRAANAG